MYKVHVLSDIGNDRTGSTKKISIIQTLKNLRQEEDIDQDETECIIANLIYEGKIKGYISHQHQKLVVSKKDAFPPLASAIA